MPYSEKHIWRVIRHSKRAMLHLALIGPNEAKHKYAVARAMEKMNVEFMTKRKTTFKRDKVVRRAEWIYDRLIRLQHRTEWKLNKWQE